MPVLKPRLDNISGLIINSMRMPVVMTDTNYRILDVNKAVNEVLGYSNEEIFGQRVLSYVEPLDTSFVSKAAEVLVNTGCIHDLVCNIIGKNGKKIPFSIDASILMDMEGNPLCIVGVGKQVPKAISERKKYEDEAFLYKSLWENSLSAVFRIRYQDVRFVKFNRILSQITGFSAAELKRINPYSLWARSDEIDIFSRTMLSERKIKRYEFDTFRKDGELRRCMISASWLIEYGFIEGSIIDITDMNRNQSVEAAGRLEDDLKVMSVLRGEAQKELGGRIITELLKPVAELKSSLSEISEDPTCSANRRPVKSVVKRAISIAGRFENSLEQIYDEINGGRCFRSALPLASRNLVDKFGAKTGKKCAFQLDIGTIELPDIVAITMYKSLDEALKILAKHTKLTEIFVSINLSDGNVVLSISGNSLGLASERYDELEMPVSLKRLEYIVQKLDGTVQNETTAGAGNIIVVKIPV